MAERAAEIAAGVTAADMPSPVIVLAATDLGAFDHVVCFRDDVHQFFSGEAGLAKAIVVAPAHRVEFTGRETVDEAIAIRRSIVTTIDFARPPMPVIRCAYANATTLEKSRRKAPLPAVWSSIHSALDSLITSDGWMALEGPNGVRADLAFSIAAPGVEAIVDGTTTLVPRGSLEGWILTTLT